MGSDTIPGLCCSLARAVCGSFCPSGPGMFSPVHLFLYFRKTPLYIIKLKIFEVSPTSGCAFFDLAMTDVRAGSEATSLLYSQGALFVAIPSSLLQNSNDCLVVFSPTIFSG